MPRCKTLQHVSSRADDEDIHSWFDPIIAWKKKKKRNEIRWKCVGARSLHRISETWHRRRASRTPSSLQTAHRWRRNAGTFQKRIHRHLTGDSIQKLDLQPWPETDATSNDWLVQLLWISLIEPINHGEKVAHTHSLAYLPIQSAGR